jgi:secreted trypsin-like serine protease
MWLWAACGGEVADDSAARPIVGGHSAKPGAFPATGALVQGKGYHCTATLIAPDVAVTAAHCLVDVGGTGLGFTLDGDITDGSLGEVVPVFRALKHPGYRGDLRPEVGQANDVGIVILTQPIEHVTPAAMLLPSLPVDVGEGIELEACGYGLALWYEPGDVGVKREATVSVATVAEWELSTAAGEAQPCNGDSGGPLFVSTPLGPRLVGVVSRSAGDTDRCDGGAIATRIGPYFDWIAEASLEESSPGCSAGGTAPLGAAPWLALLWWLKAHMQRCREARRSGRDRQRVSR